MQTDTKQKADARLAKIEGQIRAVRKMVADDRYCVDVVRQVQAARAALKIGSTHDPEVATHVCPSGVSRQTDQQQEEQSHCG